MTKRPNTSKHIPLRTCVACREIKNKREMVRLVNSASGGVQVDSSGRQPGRGAYLCRLPGCWQTGLAGNHLEYTLRTKITSENRGRLAEYGRSLNGGC